VSQGRVGFVEGGGYGGSRGWVRECADSEIQDGRYGGGGNRVFVAVHDAAGVRVADGIRIEGGASVRASSWRCQRGHLVDAASGVDGASEGWAVDWTQERGLGEDFGAFLPGRRGARSSGLEHGFAVCDAGRQMEGYEDADAVRRESSGLTWGMARAAKAQGRG
jgi:hypothetical protein